MSGECSPLAIVILLALSRGRLLLILPLLAVLVCARLPQRIQPAYTGLVKMPRIVEFAQGLPEMVGQVKLFSWLAIFVQPIR